MIRIHFTIEGNHKSIGGNPIPYKRVVKGHIRKGDDDYFAYGDYVRDRFTRTARIVEGTLEELDQLRFVRDNGKIVAIGEHGVPLAIEKPIAISSRLMQLDLKIQFANGAHGDPDNIFKAIADALVHQDKNLYGTFPIPELPRAPDGRGKVEALLTITDRKI